MIIKGQRVKQVIRCAIILNWVLLPIIIMRIHWDEGNLHCGDYYFCQIWDFHIIFSHFLWILIMDAYNLTWGRTLFHMLNYYRNVYRISWHHVKHELVMNIGCILQIYQILLLLCSVFFSIMISSSVAVTCNHTLSNSTEMS